MINYLHCSGCTTHSKAILIWNALDMGSYFSIGTSFLIEGSISAVVVLFFFFVRTIPISNRLKAMRGNKSEKIILPELPFIFLTWYRLLHFCASFRCFSPKIAETFFSKNNFSCSISVWLLQPRALRKHEQWMLEYKMSSIQASEKRSTRWRHQNRSTLRSKYCMLSPRGAVIITIVIPGAELRMCRNINDNANISQKQNKSKLNNGIRARYRAVFWIQLWASAVRI